MPMSLKGVSFSDRVPSVSPAGLAVPPHVEEGFVPVDRLRDPSDPRTSFTDIAGNTLCLGCAAFNTTNIVNDAFSAHHKILQIFWVGAKYAVTDDVDVMAGYYEYLQNSYGAGAPCSDATKPTCSGMYNAFSLALDWRLAAKLDTYAGLMYQTANAGLANGFLHHDTVDPTVGFRFRF